MIAKFSLVLFLFLAAFAQAHQIEGVLAQQIIQQLSSGGIVATDITATFSSPDIIEVIEFRAGNTICHGSRWISLDLGATYMFPEISSTRGCAYNSPQQPELNNDGTPKGDALKVDLSPLFQQITTGVYSDGGMGKFDIGLAGLTCHAFAKKLNNQIERNYMCMYTDWTL